MLDSKGFDLWADGYDESVNLSEERNEFNESREKYRHIWDDDEFYFVSEEIKKDLNNEYLCEYEKISYCAGILSIKNI